MAELKNKYVQLFFRKSLPEDRKDLVKQLFALGIGYLGAQLFILLSMPLPWMLGSMAACAAAAIVGLPIGNPKQLRSLMIPIIGVSLGSVFSPHSLEALIKMGLGLIALIAAMVAAAVSCYALYRKTTDMDEATSVFCSMPGGLAEMVILSDGAGVDTAKVALMQAVRVFTVVMAVPLWFRFSEGLTYASGRIPLSVPVSTVSWEEISLIGAIALIGGVVAVLMRLPAAILVGPLFLCVFLQLGGITNLEPVSEFVAFAQLALGTSVGSRLTLPGRKEAPKLLILGVVSAFIMIGFAAVAAMTVINFVDLPLHQVLLSFAPGGIPEMALMALALGADVTIVVSVQVARISFIILLARILLKILTKRPKTDGIASK